MKRGQKPKLDIEPKLTERICTLLGEGVSIKTACNLSGIGERTFHEGRGVGQAVKNRTLLFLPQLRARETPGKRS